MIFSIAESVENSKRIYMEDVLPDMKDFLSGYKSRLEAAGWDLDNLSDAQKIAIGLDISSFFDTFEKMPKYMRDFFNEKTLEEEFNIKINAEYTETSQSFLICRKSSMKLQMGNLKPK